MRLFPLLLLLATAPLAAQEIVEITPEMPVLGEPVRVTFDQPVESVDVTYRPGAVSAHTETFTPGAATFEFTPERAGVVSVAAGETSRSLSVRFQGTPLGGIAVMFFAGLILFGGAAISLRALLSDGHRIEVDPTLRPDT